jgi:hypothetical protein
MTDNFSCEVSCEHELLSLLGNSLGFDAYFVQTAKLDVIKPLETATGQYPS